MFHPGPLQMYYIMRRLKGNKQVNEIRDEIRKINCDNIFINILLLLVVDEMRKVNCNNIFINILLLSYIWLNAPYAVAYSCNVSAWNPICIAFSVDQKQEVLKCLLFCFMSLLPVHRYHHIDIITREVWVLLRYICDIYQSLEEWGVVFVELYELDYWKCILHKLKGKDSIIRF